MGCTHRGGTVEEGGRLVVALERDWASVKALAARCEAEGLSVRLAPCPGGG